MEKSSTKTSPYLFNSIMAMLIIIKNKNKQIQIKSTLIFLLKNVPTKWLSVLMAKEFLTNLFNRTSCFP